MITPPMQCEATVTSSSGWNRHRCDRRATKQRDGHVYCKIHDPHYISPSVKRAEARRKIQREKTDAIEAEGRTLAARLGVVAQTEHRLFMRVDEPTRNRRLVIDFEEVERLLDRIKSATAPGLPVVSNVSRYGA